MKRFVITGKLIAHISAQNGHEAKRKMELWIEEANLEDRKKDYNIYELRDAKVKEVSVF